MTVDRAASGRPPWNGELRAEAFEVLQAAGVPGGDALREITQASRKGHLNKEWVAKLREHPPKPKTEVPPPLLSPEEARRLTEEARERAQELWDLIRRLHAGGAYTALGYPSWGAYFNAEFRRLKPGDRIDPKYGYRVLRHARVEAEISVLVDTHGLTGAQADVLAPLPEELRAAIVRRVAEEGGFGKVPARRLREIRDEVTGVRRLAEGTVVWDERAIKGVVSSLQRVAALKDALADTEGMRKLSRIDAWKVRSLIAFALRDVDDARRLAQDIVNWLETAGGVLNGRGDLPPPPWDWGMRVPRDPRERANWENFDREQGIHTVRQMTLQDVLDRIREEEAAAEEEDPQ